MSRVSRAQAERHRLEIEQASARLFRERGLAVSVADLMAEVGLTHGGFYGHFESKDALAAIALARAFDEAAVRWRRRVEDCAPGDDPRVALFRSYLRPEHRDVPAGSCPLAALANDVAREPDGKPVRAAYHDGLAALLAVLQSAQPAAGSEGRQAALAQMCTLVGAMVLARATDGQPLSDELLDAARASLLAMTDPARPASVAATAGDTPLPRDR